MSDAPESTVSQLRAQWSNPSDVLSLLLIIGGDIVQKALAQTTAGSIPPVCFSFGWVAYSFTTLVGVVGDGRLLPPPDFPVKVFNLETGYVRDNKNWVVGRILRDNEAFMNNRNSLKGAGIRISVYLAEATEKRRWLSFRSERLWLLITLAQVAISAIPFGMDNEWGVFLITMSGIVAAFVAGKLPQWNVEKLSPKRREKRWTALTSGNGSREIMIIYSAGKALDLEQISAGESPRSDRVWESSTIFSQAVKRADGTTEYHEDKTEKRQALMFKGLPLGLWFTRVVCFFQSVFWIVLLITVAGLKSHSWYLVLVGSLGMIQNALVAAVSRSPNRRHLPLRLVDTIIGYKTMDGLMDLESTINGAGQALLREFFPGSLRPIEIAWWNGDRGPYDDARHLVAERGRPRSRLPKRRLDIPDIVYWNESNPHESQNIFSATMPGEIQTAEFGDDGQGEKYGSTRNESASYQSPMLKGPMNVSADSVRSPDWA